MIFTLIHPCYDMILYAIGLNLSDMIARQISGNI